MTMKFRHFLKYFIESILVVAALGVAGHTARSGVSATQRAAKSLGKTQPAACCTT